MHCRKEYPKGGYYLAIVVANHENETYFENRLVMGYADRKYYAGLVETLKVVSKRKPSMLTHVTSLKFLPTGQYGCALAIVFQVRSL